MKLETIKEPLTLPRPIRCRALSNAFMKELAEGGCYHQLIDVVRKNKDLHIEFQGNLDLTNKSDCLAKDESVIILYKGNGVLKLFRTGKVEVAPVFIEGYKEQGLPMSLKTKEDVNKYIEFFPRILFNIANRGKTSMEIEYEQMIIRANNREKRNNSEYIILANQYNIGKERWDLMALKWPRRRHGGKNPVGQLVLIEVKYALNNDIQDADKQLGRYFEYISQNLDSLCTEMELILSQKLVLGLIERTHEQKDQLQKLKLSRDISKIEMILYLVDYNPNSIWKNTMIKKAMILPFKSQIRIKIGGLAMWEKSSTPLDEEAKLLPEQQGERS